jgi:SAM-dependent methyltransferase
MQVVAVAEQAAGYPDQVRQLFEAKAPAWPAKYAPGGRLTGRLTLLAASLRRHVPAAGCVLDLGCGTGELARAAAAAGMQVTACDISDGMLRRAADRDPGRAVEWVQLEPGWRDLPFRTAAFDVVVAASVLEYVHDPGAVLGECARVLRPGGVLLCTVPNLVHPLRWLEWLAAMLARSPLLSMALRVWPASESYATYLRISAQRRTARGWRAVAGRHGLRQIRSPGDTAQLAPLRLLALRRPGEMEEA